MKDDVISRQAAIDALPKPKICDYMDEFGAGYSSCAYDAERAIEAIPATDIVLVVRCHDCKYVSEWRSEESAKKFGQVYECRKGILNCPDPNDFCSRGDRKE